MSARAPFIVSLLIIACSSYTPPARAQQGTQPPVDPAAVLAALKDLRARQQTVVNHEKANVLAAINAALADPAKAYDQAYAAVELQGGPGNEGARLAEWRKRQGDLLRNRDFINGLRLQLIYLALTWQHQMGAKSADLLAPLLDYTGQVNLAAESLAPFDQFRKGIGDTTFARYFQVTPFLAGMKGWEDHPLDVDGIFEQTILPEMRLERDPRLLTYWDNRIKAEGVRTEASQNALTINRFKAIQLPALLWSRAEDEIALGRQNQGITDMLAIVKAHPDHPYFQKWAAQLEELVSPQLPAASPSASAPASVAPAATP